jgi:TetR/AcrR family transcriptional repressor of mexCD-oprJ operon
MARPVEYMRADAARNVHRIVAVAARLLGDDPGAGMADVAAAAGVSRATVYRHFPTREALLEAIQAQAFETSEQALAACRLDEGSAVEALRRLVAAWLEIAERYSLVHLGNSAAPTPERKRVLGAPLVALMARGQASGEFSRAITPEWAARTFAALLLAGARAVADGTLNPEEAPDLVFTTLYGGLRP